MKKLILLLLFVCGAASAQPRVYNVQKYCIDSLPFKKNQCDIIGNEYSFVFVDEAKELVTFFFTDMKMKYKVTARMASETDSNWIVYSLDGDGGQVEMRVNRNGDRIEFYYPNYRIYLTVGNSTRLQ